MKFKFLTSLTLLSLLSGLTMCQAKTKSNTKMEGKKILVVYYSWSGNTRQMANDIKDATGADVFELVPQKAYATDYNQCCADAKKEIQAGYKPVLKALPTDVSKYDIIFVGSPCWWSTIAPPIYTFLTSFDLSGKTIVPFMTHGGSGFGRTVSDLKKYCPHSSFLEGKAIYGESIGDAKTEVDKWIKAIGLSK